MHFFRKNNESNPLHDRNKKEYYIIEKTDLVERNSKKEKVFIS